MLVPPKYVLWRKAVRELLNRATNPSVRPPGDERAPLVTPGKLVDSVYPATITSELTGSISTASASSSAEPPRYVVRISVNEGDGDGEVENRATNASFPPPNAKPPPAPSGRSVEDVLPTMINSPATAST